MTTETAKEETAYVDLERLLYNRIDAGLGKRDAYDITKAIDELIIQRVCQATGAKRK